MEIVIRKRTLVLGVLVVVVAAVSLLLASRPPDDAPSRSWRPVLAGSEYSLCQALVPLKEEVLLGCARGVFMLSLPDGIASPLPIPSGEFEEWGGLYVLDLDVDRNGIVWLAHDLASVPLSSFDLDASRWRAVKDVADVEGNEMGFSVLCRDGEVYLTTQRHLWRFDGMVWRDVLPGSFPREDERPLYDLVWWKGAFWLATQGGVWRGREGRWERIGVPWARGREVRTYRLLPAGSLLVAGTQEGAWASPSGEVWERVKGTGGLICALARGGDGVIYAGGTEGLWQWVPGAQAEMLELPAEGLGSVTALTWTPQGLLAAFEVGEIWLLRR